MPSSRASSSPRSGGRRRPVGAPVERRAHQLARQLQVRGDRGVGLACRAWPAGRRRTSSVTSTSTGVVRVEVAVDRRAAQRALVHEEAEHEVWRVSRLEEAAQALARAQPPAERRDHLLAARVVAR